MTSYTLRRNFSTKWDFLSTAWVYPFFHQDWKLFVPPPDSNYRLFVVNGPQKGEDVFSSLLVRHRSNRLAGYGHQLTSLANLIHYFEKNTAAQKPLNGPVQNDLNFNMLLKAVQGLVWQQYVMELEPRIILIVTEVKSGRSRAYYN